MLESESNLVTQVWVYGRNARGETVTPTYSRDIAKRDDKRWLLRFSHWAVRNKLEVAIKPIPNSKP